MKLGFRESGYVKLHPYRCNRYRPIYIEVLLLEAGHYVVVVFLFAAMLKC